MSDDTSPKRAPMPMVTPWLLLLVAFVVVALSSQTVDTGTGVLVILLTGAIVAAIQSTRR